MSLAQRSVRSSTYNIIASGIQTIVLFGRSILLARLLTPEEFGIYTFAASLVLLTSSLPQFGMTGGLLHRAQESEGEIALRVHFTLSLVFNIVWGIALATIGMLFIARENIWVLWTILITQIIDNLVQTGKTVLIRNVAFQRIAVISTLSTLATTGGALILAWQGFGLISLVSTDIIAAIIFLVGFYVYRPVWKPRLGWSRSVVHYLLDFGKRTFLAGVLGQALDRVDDLWTGKFLGDTALGFYSRAYTFATYPRRVLAAPLNAVAAGTYAELKNDKKRLSQAFFRVNAFLVRTGFLFAGLLTLVAPEFIRIFIGTKWLPMLVAFRLMLVYTLLDPIKQTIASIFVAVGRPEKIVWARILQLLILLALLFILGPYYGIAGVAIAVVIMLLSGIAMLLWLVREYVNYSIASLFLVPSISLTASMIIARVAIEIPGILGSPWRSGVVKTVIFVPVYLFILLAIEREEILKMIKFATRRGIYLDGIDKPDGEYVKNR